MSTGKRMRASALARRRYVLNDSAFLVRSVSRKEQRGSFGSGRELLRQMRELAVGGRSMLSELSGPAGVPGHGKHLPAGDAHDPRLGYRYYYHCHEDAGGRRSGEHGHFHLFADAGADGAVTHLVAIAVDARGMPQRLFTTNRWVTSERWRGAARVLSLLDGFALRRPRALSRVNHWLAALLAMFRPQLRWLLQARDARVRAAGTRLLGNRRVPVLSQCRISIAEQSAALDAAVIA